MKFSWYESTARQRIAALLESDSFQEFAPPQERHTSPHLASLDLPVALDDGVIVGCGTLQGSKVFAAAQEGGFMGGAVGEVHGAKIVGLLERALDERPAAVLLLVESGGVRLHEANAGLIGISEIMRALLAVRAAGIPVIALVGGRYGCFGGMGIVARLCDAVIMSELGRLGLSGPEVIETTCGVEEFDASDRALVWRTVGGKHRYLLGEAVALVADNVDAFREAACTFITAAPDLSLAALEAEHSQLATRLERFGDCADAVDIWTGLGIDGAARLPILDAKDFLAAIDRRGA